MAGALSRSLFLALATLLAAASGAAAADGERTPLDLRDTPSSGAQVAGHGGSSIARTLAGLAIVIGVIYGLTWVLRQVKRAREESASGSGLQPLATLPLGANRSLHLVRAGSDVVLLAAGEGGVAPIRTYAEAEARAAGLLAPHDDDDGAPPPAPSSSAPAPGWLARLRARTEIR